MKSFVCLFLSIAVLSNNAIIALAQNAELDLPASNELLMPSQEFSLPLLKGLKFNPEDPLNLEFVFDSASHDRVNEDDVKRLVEYFIAGLAIPESEFWVNLSPYESDRVIPNALADKSLGRDMLAQDYVLKQLSSSLMYPESDGGKIFWQKLWSELGDKSIDTDLFNKIWIVPDEVIVYENGTQAHVDKANFKVMLEKDYLAMQENKAHEDNRSSELMRSVVLPAIERQVNEGKHFSAIRQIQNSLVLAMWFKRKFANTFYKDYFNTAQLKGIDIDGKLYKQKIFKHYVNAFKDGVFDYTRKERDLSSGKIVKRHYFSGGISERNISNRTIIKYGRVPADSFINNKFSSSVSIISALSSSVNADEIDDPKRVTMLAGLKSIELDKIIDHIVGKPVRVKGRVPDGNKFDYKHHMLQVWTDQQPIDSMEMAVDLIADEFAAAGRTEIVEKLREKAVSDYTMDEYEELSIKPINKLIHLFFPFLKGREHLLFDSQQVYPFSWKELQNERIIFSLGHVDTRIKIILQDIADSGAIESKEVANLAEKAHRILASLLKADDFALTQYVNNMLVVYLQDRVIQLLVGNKAYEHYRNKILVPDLQAKNNAAIEQVKQIFPLALKEKKQEVTDRFVALQVLAGVCFPQDKRGELFRPTNEFEQIVGGLGANAHMGVNDIMDLFKDIQNADNINNAFVEFFLDDVGEGIFDLLFMEALLDMFPGLKLRIWVNSYPVENNFSVPEFYRVLADPYFSKLRTFLQEGRLMLNATNVPLVCPDPRFFKQESLEALEKATAVIIKGASFFETNQFENVNAYYGFANYHKATMETTGIPMGKGVFAHVPRGQKAYQYLSEEKRFRTLLEMRRTKQFSSAVSVVDDIGGISLRESLLANIVPFDGWVEANEKYYGGDFAIKVRDLRQLKDN